MPLPQVGFQALLFALANNAGLNADPSQGAVSQLVNIPQWTQYLNDAVLWAWRPDQERPEVVWPYTILSGSITPSSGVISFSQIGNGDWWRIWSADPRPYANPPSAFPIADTWDAAGIYPRSGLTSVFAFWRPFRPQFTYSPVNTGGTYNAGALVYDALASQNVFLANANSAPGNNLADTKWTQQTVPDPLVRMILAKAEGFRVKAKGNDPTKELADADAIRDAEKARMLPALGSPPPWGFDMAA